MAWLESEEEWQEKISMNKHFLIGIISTLVGFMIYDIVSTIKVRREIERNKKIRQKKYEQRLNELKKQVKQNETKRNNN